MLFGLYFSPSDTPNKYAFYIIAYVVPLLLLYYLTAKYIIKIYKARKVFISKRNPDKYPGQDKYNWFLTAEGVEKINIIIADFWRWYILNKAELIEVTSQKTNLSKKDLGKAVDALLNTIGEALAEGNKVRLAGFGTFATKRRAARKVYNPTNKAKIKVKAKTIPVFKAGKNLKDLAEMSRQVKK